MGPHISIGGDKREHHDNHSQSPKRNPHARTFSRKGQLPKLILALGSRWLLTLVFCAALVGTLYGYSSEPGMTSDERRIFNAVFISLTLLLGLHLVSSLKVMAAIFRWHLLARSARSVAELDLVLKFESFWSVWKLIFGAASWRFRIFCLTWLMVAISFQAAIALVGINYTVQDAIIWSKEPGEASITDFSAIFGFRLDLLQGSQTLRRVRPVEDPPLSEQQQVAYYLGLMGNGIPTTLANLSDRTTGPQRFIDKYKPGYFLNDETIPITSIVYFLEVQNAKRFNPDGSSLALSSERSVKVGYVCAAFDVPSGQGREAGNVTIQRGTVLETVFIPEVQEGEKTFIYDPSRDCGPRCAGMMAFEPPVEDFNAFYYECDVTVYPVQGAENAIQEIPDSTAKLVAASIALTGNGTDENGLQHRLYPSGTGLGAFSYGIGDLVGFFCASSSVLTIHSLDLANPVLFINAKRPVIGHILEVQWDYVAAVFAAIVGSQFGLSILTLFWGNRAVVLDQSSLPQSRLLHTVTEPLGSEGGCMLSGREIAEAYPGDEVRPRKVSYGIRGTRAGFGGAIYQLDIAHDIEPRRGSFPDGLYDGPMG